MSEIRLLEYWFIGVISALISRSRRVHKHTLRKYHPGSPRWHINYRLRKTIEDSVQHDRTHCQTRSQRATRKRLKVPVSIIIPRGKPSGKKDERFAKVRHSWQGCDKRAKESGLGGNRGEGGERKASESHGTFKRVTGSCSKSRFVKAAPAISQENSSPFPLTPGLP